MAYHYSQLDKTNLNWFDKDQSKATLIRLEIQRGRLRGLGDVELQFKYPITAISGKNGTGKSTLLGCVCCAYHNTPSGFKPINRKTPYYTFSDFLIHSEEESSPSGVKIAYQFLHDNWRKSANVPTGKGLAWQMRTKERRGKWNKYSTRIKRNVVFLGIERVVPHSEKSVSKSYRHAFVKGDLAGFEKLVRETVGRIVGRKYEDFYFKTHSKYRLPLVSTSNCIYSGFNMGAGENALFEIFSTIYACSGSLILVIDEIELGLHEEAQARLINELKKICEKRHIQIVCSTHSPRILNSLPPEARIHLELRNEKVKAIPEISAEYAAGLLAGGNSAELDIFCEDRIAQSILSLSLPNDIRSRVRIVPIGSSAAVTRHLAARFLDPGSRPACGFLDGDKSLKKQEHVNIFLKTLEHVKSQDDATQWIENRLAFLPGSTWPEQWVIQKHLDEDCCELAEELIVSEDDLSQLLKEAELSEPHNELQLLAARLNLPRETTESYFIRSAIDKCGVEMDSARSFVSGFLS